MSFTNNTKTIVIEGLPMSDFNGDTLFGGDAEGYTSYSSYVVEA